MDRIQFQEPSGLWPPTWPMGLTMLRLLLLPLFLWALLVGANDPGRPHRWIAIAVYVVMAITDKLDGYLARRLNQTSKLGALLDPIADKLLIASSVVLLSFEWIAPEGFAIPLWVVAAIYGKDVITAVGTLVVLSVVGNVTIAPRPLGRVGTVVQLSLIGAVLLAPTLSSPWAPGWQIFVRALWWTVSILAVLACLDYVRQGWLQYVGARRSGSVQSRPEARG
jgi:cardiolipin synthase (CMP-forming)